MPHCVFTTLDSGTMLYGAMPLFAADGLTCVRYPLLLAAPVEVGEVVLVLADDVPLVMPLAVLVALVGVYRCSNASSPIRYGASAWIYTRFTRPPYVNWSI